MAVVPGPKHPVAVTTLRESVPDEIVRCAKDLIQAAYAVRATDSVPFLIHMDDRVRDLGLRADILLAHIRFLEGTNQV